MRKLFCILILALTSTLAYAQRPDQIELPCPAGSSPTLLGQSFDQQTSKYRQWQCVDNQGNIYQTVVGGVKADLSNLTNPTAINLTTLTFIGAAGLTAGGTNQNITLTPSGTGNVLLNNGLTTQSPLIYFQANGTNEAHLFSDPNGAISLKIVSDTVANSSNQIAFSSDGSIIERFTTGQTYNLGSINANGSSNVLGIIASDSSGNVSLAGTISSPVYKTATNCASSASPAVCGSAAAGHFVIAASATSVVVDTTAVTANSEILINEDQTQGTNLGVTCNTGISSQPVISAVTPGTSFTVTISTGLATNPVCYGYSIIN